MIDWFCEHRWGEGGGFWLSSYFFYKICISDGNFLYPKKKKKTQKKKKKELESVGIFAAGIDWICFSHISKSLLRWSNFKLGFFLPNTKAEAFWCCVFDVGVCVCLCVIFRPSSQFSSSCCSCCFALLCFALLAANWFLSL